MSNTFSFGNASGIRLTFPPSGANTAVPLDVTTDYKPPELRELATQAQQVIHSVYPNANGMAGAYNSGSVGKIVNFFPKDKATFDFFAINAIPANVHRSKAHYNGYVYRVDGVDKFYYSFLRHTEVINWLVHTYIRVPRGVDPKTGITDIYYILAEPRLSEVEFTQRLQTFATIASTSIENRLYAYRRFMIEAYSYFSNGTGIPINALGEFVRDKSTSEDTTELLGDFWKTLENYSLVSYYCNEEENEYAYPSEFDFAVPNDISINPNPRCVEATDPKFFGPELVPNVFSFYTSLFDPDRAQHAQPTVIMQALFGKLTPDQAMQKFTELHIDVCEIQYDSSGTDFQCYAEERATRVGIYCTECGKQIDPMTLANPLSSYPRGFISYCDDTNCSGVNAFRFGTDKSEDRFVYICKIGTHTPSTVRGRVDRDQNTVVIGHLDGRHAPSGQDDMASYLKLITLLGYTDMLRGIDLTEACFIFQNSYFINYQTKNDRDIALAHAKNPLTGFCHSVAPGRNFEPPARPVLRNLHAKVAVPAAVPIPPASAAPSPPTSAPPSPPVQATFAPSKPAHPASKLAQCPAKK